MSGLLMPAGFVLLWSTGWIVAGIATPHAGPLTFLSLRYACAIALLAPLAVVLRVRWPQGRAAWLSALGNGVLLHGVYLGGVWWAIEHGVPAGLSALIAALQPLFTAVAAGPLVGERLGPRRGLGVLMGFAGVAAVVAPKLMAIGAGAALAPIAVNVLAMAAVTAATLHQKRSLAGNDLRALALIQYLGALVVTAPIALFFEGWRFEWTASTALALAWSVIALSIVAIFAMLAMIARGEVSRVSALMFLVPPIAAVQAYLFFGERLSLIQIAGMALAAAGVLLVNARVPPLSAEGCIAAKLPDDEDGPEILRRPVL